MPHTAARQPALSTKHGKEVLTLSFNAVPGVPCNPFCNLPSAGRATHRPCAEPSPSLVDGTKRPQSASQAQSQGVTQKPGRVLVSHITTSAHVRKSPPLRQQPSKGLAKIMFIASIDSELQWPPVASAQIQSRASALAACVLE